MFCKSADTNRQSAILLCDFLSFHPIETPVCALETCTAIRMLKTHTYANAESCARVDDYPKRNYNFRGESLRGITGFKFEWLNEPVGLFEWHAALSVPRKIHFHGAGTTFLIIPKTNNHRRRQSGSDIHCPLLIADGTQFLGPFSRCLDFCNSIIQMQMTIHTFSLLSDWETTNCSHSPGLRYSFHTSRCGNRDTHECR